MLCNVIAFIVIILFSWYFFTRYAYDVGVYNDISVKYFGNLLRDIVARRRVSYFPRRSMNFESRNKKKNRTLCEYVSYEKHTVFVYPVAFNWNSGRQKKLYDFRKRLPPFSDVLYFLLPRFHFCWTDFACFFLCKKQF